MAARDAFHESVKQALIKDGWIVTHDPLVIRFDSIDFYIDLGAEKLIAAEKSGVQIAVEIKSFLSTSIVSEFHTALGQFLNYRFVLQEKEPARELYLAVPVDIHETFFNMTFAKGIISQYQVKLLIYHPYMQEVKQWIS